MKIQFYVSLLVLTLSCGQGSKTEKANDVTTQDAIETIETDLDSLPKSAHFDFDEMISQIKPLELPHIEKTNFDSFIDEGDYEEIDAPLVKLDQIYLDYNREGFNPKVIAMHRLPLSESFVSIIATILKSEHEMETLLVNFDKEGKIIAHQVAAYDEIAEGMSQVVSRVSEGNLTVNHIFWGDTKKIEEETFEILYDGKIDKIATKNLNDTFEDFSLINAVLMELELDWIQTKTNLISTMVYPEIPIETIVVIPEIVAEGEHYFELNSHIVIADTRSGSITHKFFESSRTNQWVSDAIELRDISIDTAPYLVADDKRAFGVRVSYHGMSRVNPYQNETLSLFIRSEDGLQKILSNYDMEDSGGEWDGNCQGEFVDRKNILVISDQRTQGFFDITVKGKITETINEMDENGECDAKEKITMQTLVLKFNGEEYIDKNQEKKNKP